MTPFATKTALRKRRRLAAPAGAVSRVAAGQPCPFVGVLTNQRDRIGGVCRALGAGILRRIPLAGIAARTRLLAASRFHPRELYDRKLGRRHAAESPTSRRGGRRDALEGADLGPELHKGAASHPGDVDLGKPDLACNLGLAEACEVPEM